MKKKVAIVIQRYAPDTAGSEQHARITARLLAERYEVEVLTTTASDMVTWRNHFSPGETSEGSIKVKRFEVTSGRQKTWEGLYALMLRRLKTHGETGWPLSLEEEWIRLQGPHSEGLLAYLSEHQQNYDAVIFYTYLYSPTYFGTACVEKNRSLLMPTLHDEPAARLACYAHAARRVKRVVWNTFAEQKLGEKLWGNVPGTMTGLPIDIPDPVSPFRAAPYVLYSGRIEPGKGCDDLVGMIQNSSARVDLRLTGTKYMKLSGSRIHYEGYVTAQKKLELLAGCICFAMPSPNESLSIATLEAMAAGVPVLVNGRNPVLREHVEESGGGLCYESPDEFNEAVLTLKDNADLRFTMGEKGRVYVERRFSHHAIRDAWISAIESEA